MARAAEKAADGRRRGGRAEYWRALIEQWQASGLTQVEFCRRRGVSVTSLRWWKWELGRRGVRGAAQSRPGSARGSREPETKRAAATPAFLPVRIVAPRVAESPAREVEPPAPAGAFEVILPAGVRLRVPPGFDGAELERLLAALGAARC